MHVPANLYARWEQHHAAAERSRMLAELETERRVATAKARVQLLLAALERAARLEFAAVT